MENIIKGWVLSLIGLTGIVLIGLHASGVYEFPSPDFLNNTWEVMIGLIVCFGLFIIPKTKIEAMVEGLLGSVVSMFKKKTE